MMQSEDITTPYNLIGKNDVLPLLKKRNKFDHKGNFGHGLLFPDLQERWEHAFLVQEQHCGQVLDC